MSKVVICGDGVSPNQKLASLLTTGGRFKSEVENATPVMRVYYRHLREQGLKRADAKSVLEQAIKCAILDESFGDGVDVDVKD